MNDNNDLHFDNYDVDDTKQNSYYTDMNGNQFANRAMGGASPLTLNQFIAGTFLWMMAGLLVTFGIAMFAAVSGLVHQMALGGSLQIVLIGATIAEFIVVIALSAMVQKLSVGMARLLFFVYAALTGFTFSLYFMIFDLSVLILAFAITAVMFGGMAAAAKIFRLQLDSIRPYIFTGLIMLIVLGVVNIFLNLAWMDMLLCYAGIAIFLAYTAYDVSRLKNYYYYYSGGDGSMLAKASIFGALQLYLDFVNLFLRILRILALRGSRSRD